MGGRLARRRPTPVSYTHLDVYKRQALVCDDIAATVAELTGRGARFTREIRDEGWGLTAPVEVPGADPILIYQARHPLAAFGVN